MTTTTDLDTLVGNGFTTTEKSTAITLARKYLGTVEGNSDGDDLATAMLSANILNNRRKAEKSKTDNSIAPLADLMTKEIMSLLTNDSTGTFKQLIYYEQPSVSKHWSQG